MLTLPRSLVIEATADPRFFGYFSPTLAGFSGTAVSVDDCLAQAGPAMAEHRGLLAETGRPVPPAEPAAVVVIRNEPADAAPAPFAGAAAPAAAA